MFDVKTNRSHGWNDVAGITTSAESSWRSSSSSQQEGCGTVMRSCFSNTAKKYCIDKQQFSYWSTWSSRLLHRLICMYDHFGLLVLSPIRSVERLDSSLITWIPLVLKQSTFVLKFLRLAFFKEYILNVLTPLIIYVCYIFFVRYSL